METHEEENENESGLKKDKIFQNDFESSEFELPSTKFTVEGSYREKSLEEKIDENFVKVSVEFILQTHEKFKKYSTPNEEGEYPKVNKSEINEVYSYIINELPKLPKIEIFSTLSEFYDISSEKFYESLSNTFKTQLIIELRNRGYLKKRNFLF
jgi:hypothetical protein